MFRQSCPGPCQFCTTRNSACDALEIFQGVDTNGVNELRPEQVAELMVELHPNFWTDKRTRGLLEAMKLDGKETITFVDLIQWLFQADDPEDLVAPLGLTLATADDIAYGPEYQPPVLTCGLLMVPHGSTISNAEHLFQNHSDGEKSQLIAEGISQVERGALDFATKYGKMIQDNPGSWAIYRSPLKRCKDTAAIYQAAFDRAGIQFVEPRVDLDVIEINHGSWGENDVDGLIIADRMEDAVNAEKYRGGSFTAKPVDGSGESLLEVIARAAAWLERLQARHGSGKTNVLVFGHGTFQNAVELLLRTYPDKEPRALFTRVTGGSHLRRGSAHVITQLV